MFFDASQFILIFYFLACSFAVSILATPFLTNFLYKNEIWKKSRKEAITGEKAVVYQAIHKEKHQHNTPTMAGVLIIFVVALFTLLFNFSRSGTYLPLFTFVTFGLLGFIDDYINVRSTTSVGGMRFRTKLAIIIALAALGALWFYYKLDWTIINIPAGNIFGLPYSFDLGVWYIPLFMLVIIASSNAVNITDGLDGLAGGLLAIAFGVYTFIALFQGKVDLAIFCATIVGAVLSYTWFNIYPARFLMGDTGSLALGATLGVIAMLTNTALILPIIGFVFVLDTASVIVQIFWKKVFGRKLIPISPLHHTFEYIGWPEAKVTMRFWIIGAISGVVGLGVVLLSSPLL